MDGLGPGRIVHYVARTSEIQAAIVTGVWDQEHGFVNLAVFADALDASGVLTFGLEFHREVEYSEEHKLGTWHWIYPGQATGRRPAPPAVTDTEDIPF